MGCKRGKFFQMFVLGIKKKQDIIFQIGILDFCSQEPRGSYSLNKWVCGFRGAPSWNKEVSLGFMFYIGFKKNPYHANNNLESLVLEKEKVFYFSRRFPFCI